jgi:hypothetical protein
VKNGFDTRMSQVSTYSVRTVGNGLFVCVAGAKNGRHLFIVVAKCYEKLNFAILINKTCCLWPP